MDLLGIPSNRNETDPWTINSMRWMMRLDISYVKENEESNYYRLDDVFNAIIQQLTDLRQKVEERFINIEERLAKIEEILMDKEFNPAIMGHV